MDLPWFPRRSLRAGLPAWVLLAVCFLLCVTRAVAAQQREQGAAAIAGEHNDPPVATAGEQEGALGAHIVTLPVRTAAEMTKEDAALLARREADVSRAAAFYGFDISDSIAWTYRQVVCSALPEHLILAFTNETSAKGPSRFVAVVPHDTGDVQVVSDVSHGLLPYHPVWKSGNAYSVFNRMVVADRGERALRSDSRWLNLAMCYVALAGGTIPQVADPFDDVAASEALVKRDGVTPIIRVGDHGAADVVFSDVQQPRRTANWVLSFDRDGRLKKADLSENKPIRVRDVPMSAPLPPIVPN
ncbi:MAG: hypothetical protein ACR2JE_12990 [Acidobacteriaceae bacterium]